MSELLEKGVSNNQFFRNISNRLDSVPGFKDSRQRAKLHGDYHLGMSLLKFCCFNFEGAAAEFKRAGVQYYKAEVGLPGEFGD